MGVFDNSERQSIDNLDSVSEKPFYSKAYHRYFEGFTEYTVVGKNGKKTIERIYTGNYFRQNMALKLKIILRIVYCVFFLSALALFLTSPILMLTGKGIWYIVLPQATVLPVFLYLFITLLFYITAPEKLTIAKYRSTSKIINLFLKVAIIILTIEIMATFFYIFVNQLWPAENLWIGILHFTLSGFLLFCMNQVESRVPYLEIQNMNIPPTNGVEV